MSITATITDCFRLGKFKSETTKPGTFIVTLLCVWDRNRILREARMLKNYKTPVFVTQDLTSAERVIQQKLLKERWALINGGTNRKHLKIRNFKLYRNDTEVQLTN
mgnify:CR=1 FL=1